MVSTKPYCTQPNIQLGLKDNGRLFIFYTPQVFFILPSNDKLKENPDPTLPGKCFLPELYITYDPLTQDEQNEPRAKSMYLFLDRINMCHSSANTHKAVQYSLVLRSLMCTWKIKTICNVCVGQKKRCILIRRII